MNLIRMTIKVFWQYYRFVCTKICNQLICFVLLHKEEMIRRIYIFNPLIVSLITITILINDFFCIVSNVSILSTAKFQL